MLPTVLSNMSKTENNENNNNNINEDDDSVKLAPLKWTFKDIYWKNVILLSVIHLQFPYGLYLCVFGCYGYTALFAYIYSLLGGMGISSGNHRYWSHRSFKANLPYQILVMLLSTTTFQDDIIFWCRNHRIHHKFSDTDCDPHNSKRGFFFSHIGWLLLKERPTVAEKSKQVDISDLINDPVLQFQRKYFYPLTLIFFVLIPTYIPTLWGESVWVSFNVCVLFKLTVQFNVVVTVNSLAHMYGTRPYDQRICPSQNYFANFITAGEGWHNYHHTFPYDYRAAEFGALRQYNLSKMFIDFFAFIGWVYELRTASTDTVAKRKARTGIKE